MILLAEQPNGELIRLEEWVYLAWISGRLVDPVLTGPLVRAVEIRQAW